MKIMKNKKNTCIREGFSFGIASGVTTTLGLMVGLYSSTNSRYVVMGGIISIALSDALSDAFGVHLSEESEGIHTTKEIWTTTITTFLSKFFVALSFIVPMLLFSVHEGIIYNILWGFLLVGVFSAVLAKKQKANPYFALLEHFMIMIIVLLATYYSGFLIQKMFLNQSAIIT